MKLNKFIWSLAALAALGLTACSSEHLADEPSGPNLPGFNEDGEGYLAVSINLPSTSAGSRADATDSDNDQFVDGTPEEYAVKSAMLILFTGTNIDGSDAKYDRHYDLAGYTVADNTTTNITETITKIIKVKGKVTPTNRFLALVLLNWKGTTSITSEGNTLSIGGTTLTSTSTYESVASTLLPPPTSSMHFKSGFLMTNSPIVNATTAPGTTYNAANTVTTLVDVTSSIKTTEQAAKDNAATINVERVSAKVDLIANTPSTTGLKISSATYTYGSGLGATTIAAGNISAAITGWQIANIEPNSYLVRKWQNQTQKAALDWLNLISNVTTPPVAVTNHGYRFAGYTADPYRTYWCYDPNYDNDATLEASGAAVKAIPALITGASMTDPQYIFENTFDLEHQNIKNTTCAIFEVTFTITGYTTGFYTVGDDNSILYNETNIKNYIGDVASKNFNTKILELASGIAGSDPITFVGAEISVGADKKVSVQTVTFQKNSNNIVLHQGNSGYTTEQWNNFFSALNIYNYTGSKAYYYIPIKHFGDELCPWNDSYAEGTDSYKTDSNWDNNKWLGRYGIVRNNWYRLEVSAVNGIGSATVPDLHDNPDWDDQTYSYLALKINVLAWAQRKQSVVLQ